MKQISLVQVQPQHTVTQSSQEIVYIKNEPQILSTIPSTSTAIIVSTSEPPAELIIPDVKVEEIQIDSQNAINLFTNPDPPLLTSIEQPLADDSIEMATEVKLEDVPSG